MNEPAYIDQKNITQEQIHESDDNLLIGSTFLHAISIFTTLLKSRSLYS